MTKETQIKQAATVVIIRDTSEQPEILMVKRSSKSQFMAGIYVFPGGKVDQKDYSYAKNYLSEPEKDFCENMWADTIDRLESCAFASAALRECAEECGVFYCLKTNQQQISSAEQQNYFKRLKTGEDFYTLLEKENLKINIKILKTFSWWLTPKEEKKRYDTRFFITKMPTNQNAYTDDFEVNNAKWLSAQSALHSYQQKEIIFAPPTFATLEDLKTFQTTQDILQNTPNAILQICPKRIHQDHQSIFALPGDRLHPVKELAWPHRSRIIFKDGLLSSHLEKERKAQT